MAARSVQEVAQELTSSGEPSPAFGPTLKGKTENLSGKVQKKVGQIEQVSEKQNGKMVFSVADGSGFGGLWLGGNRRAVH